MIPYKLFWLDKENKDHVAFEDKTLAMFINGYYYCFWFDLNGNLIEYDYFLTKEENRTYVNNLGLYEIW